MTMKLILTETPKNHLREPSVKATDFDALPALVEGMIEESQGFFLQKLTAR